MTLHSLIPLALLAASIVSADETHIALMTYNLRLDISSDGPNQWERRREQVASQIGFHRPDVCGIQEGLSQQIDYLEQNLPHYDYVGVGRDDAQRAGEFSAILSRQFEEAE